MSGAASVNLKEVDLSTRVASFGGVFGGIIIPALKGPLDEPLLSTSDTQFLNSFTPDGRVEVGYDLSYFSALAFLERANKLWVQRVANTSYFGGLLIKDGLVADVKASFDAIVTGVTGNVQLEANVAGTDGNAILLTGDGVKTLTILVSDWNTANPSNLVTLLSANGADVPDDLEAMQLAGGAGNNDGIPSGSNVDDPSAFVLTADDSLFIHAANEGAWANNIGIKVFTYVEDADDIEMAADNAIFRIEVYRVTNTVAPVETFYASRVLGKKNGKGQNVYVEDVLNGSAYIRAISNPVVDEAQLPKKQEDYLSMVDGDDGLAVTDSQMTAGLNQAFANVNDRSVTLIMDGGYAVPAYQLAIDTVAQNRQDCVGIFSVPYADEVSAAYLNDILDYRKTDLNLNSSHSAIYSPHLKISDRFNDREIWIAPDGHVCGSISLAAANFEIWYPPAGYNRGILNVLDTRQRFSDGEMDALYNAGINPIRFTTGRGIVVWGQKTLLSRASALDRLNVRLLLIVIEPAIKLFLEDYLFELNDEGTRAIIETKLESYLETIKARRGITDYDVVADDSNNSPEDVDANRLNVDIFIKPTRSVEEIPVRVVITPNNISFSQAAGSI